MRKYNYIFLLLLFLFAGVTFYFFPVKIDKNIPLKSLEKLTPADRMDLAIKQEILMTKDPATGTVPKERLLEAVKQRDRMLRKGMNSIPGITWEERGPNNFPGRTRAIMIDPNDPTKKTIWVASVSGGLWKTTDITANPPGWQNVNDFFNNLAIVSLAYDPTNTNIMYFGTGEIINYGLSGVNGVKGMGIWKTTDGGATWNYLTSTSGTEFNYCQRILVTNLGTVLVATGSGGVQRSTDGGNTWTKVLGTGLGITGANSDLAYDLERTTIPANQYTRIFASLRGSIHLSTDDGVTFSDSLPTGVTADRIELAVTTDSYTQFVIALFEKDGRAVAIKNSFNAGSTWNDIPLPTIPPTSDNDSVFTRKQGEYDLTIDVDPNNHNNYYVGGIYLHRGYYNSIYHYYAWEQLTNTNGTTVHADQHIIIHEPGNSNLFYVGNDGGIYQGTLQSDGSHTFVSKGEGYNTNQFYSCALHPDANTDYFLGGTQDNGSLQFSNSGINAAVEVSFGDGGFCHIDQNEPQFQFTSYIVNQFYHRSTDGGQSFVTFDNCATCIGGLFIAPSDYDDVNNIMYQSAGLDYYERWDNPTTATPPYTYSKEFYLNGHNSLISAIKVSPNSPTTVYFGFVNGNLRRVDNANTDNNRIVTVLLDGNSPTPAAYISCVEVEKGNENHIIITFSNYGVNSIWETLDGGTTWNSVEGNLPDIPVRWVIFNPLDADQAFIATELGVWSTDNLDGANTVWETTNSGLANVRVSMLQTRTSDNLILAATHGRGMFTAHVGPVAFFHSDKQEVYPNEPISFIDSSFYATSWLWDFGDGTTSTEQNPVHAYTTWGTYTVTLSVNNGYNTEVKTNYIKVRKVLGTPYQLTDGGNFEVNPEDFKVVTLSGTSWERGNSVIQGKDGTNSPSNAWVTGITEDNYSNNSTSYLYTPEFNFTAAGQYLIGFYAKYSLAVNNDAMDGFFVEYSIDSNKTWQPILGERGFTWWPESGIFTGQSVPDDNNPNGFTLYYKDISYLAGHPVVGFRFTFYSDNDFINVGAAIDDFQIGGVTNPPLPVELTSFTGTSQKNGILLKWTTATEVNNYGFEIERASTTPRQDDWEKIGFVEGHGNSNSPKKYSYIDSAKLSGTVSYRLKQIDTDGKFEYSDVVEVDVALPQEYKLEQNYPNPFNPGTTISFTLPKKSDVKLVVFNSLGEKVSELINGNKEAGNYKVKFDASNLSSGIYFYRISAGNFVDVKKMILLK